MSAADEDPGKCSRKTALAIFFLLELIAYLLSCIALISPSWQYVYLENGRTEHHHGLWLDCKRDYSHDYGRSREYYETLYRLDKQQSPLDQFFLTSLLCVYKFDYYIDSEDLFDHNHDENRLQDDANQHLLLGWKLASLAAFGFATLTAGAALLLSVCAFCHRTLICAAAVLVTVAALLSSAGLLVFYIWANYQDNNIIKEEDGIYEQHFGWALYMQIAGTFIYFLASFMGCVTTAIAFKKDRAKLVKIEVVDGDESILLDKSSSLPFKRSFSAVYKVDSAALRRWEKDYMNLVKSGSAANRNNFKRATSVPNFKKYPRVNQKSPDQQKITKSISDLFTSTDYCNFSTTTKTFTSTARAGPSPAPPTPKSILKASSKRAPSLSEATQHLSDDPDLTYEYLPCDSVGKSQSMETITKSVTPFTDTADIYDQNRSTLDSRNHPETAVNVYDKVYEHIPDAIKPGVYEQPNSYRTRNPRGAAGNTAIKTCRESKSASPALDLRNFAVEQRGSPYSPSQHSSGAGVKDVVINTFDIGTFAAREGQKSIKNLAFRPSENENVEEFERSDSSGPSSLGTFTSNKRRKYLRDETDRSVGSSATLENETVQDEKDDERCEAELRLNLFMNAAATTPLVFGSNLSQAKESNITTV
ncbi:unnamed protein product [Gongylonema pulchrum]|uniref:Clc-like protein n=1 Tax=Gongylonema pulchrum TaxID=637853 RepID=A0A183CUV4_9BILA|nr:unnamed protein product [Gongylonema pulchrum]